MRSLQALLGALVLLLTASANAQQTEAPASAPALQPAGEDRFRALEEKLAAQQKRIDELEAKDEAQNAEVAAVRSDMDKIEEDETSDQLQGSGAGTFTQFFRVYGFYDLTFSKYFYDEQSAFGYVIEDTWSFTVNSLNLYIASQMTETVSSLVELRFSFQPQGEETDFPQTIVDEDGEPIYTLEDHSYQRTDTTLTQQYTTMYLKSGSVAIERAHLTYAPVDWFNVMAGYFLTPYGIWNIDHGAPVVLPVRIPYMQIREMMPLSQLGLQIYGRFFPMDTLYLDYAVTVSNGRGPMDTVWDLDDNKGVGLKLKIAYEGDKVRVALGGYGYYGEYTDHEKEFLVTADGSQLFMNETVTENYQEVCLSGDFLLELFGVRLQAEYVRRYVLYDIPRHLASDELIMVTGDPAEVNGPYFMASNIGQGVYGILSYELPLDRWIAPVKIIPYLLVENNQASEVLSHMSIDYLIIGGLNVRPSPYVILKAEYGLAQMKDERWGSALQSFSAQVAVSF